MYCDVGHINCSNACKKIGIYVPKKTTLHCLRHTFAVKKYLETRDLYEVCKRLKHDKLSTTQIYAKFNWKRLDQDFPSLVPKEVKMDKCKTKVQNYHPNKSKIT